MSFRPKGSRNDDIKRPKRGSGQKDSASESISYRDFEADAVAVEVRRTGIERAQLKMAQEHEITSLYLKTFPRTGPELDQFVADQCAYYHFPPRHVRRVVARAAYLDQIAMLNSRQSLAQRAAHVMDMGIEVALGVVKDGLKAVSPTEDGDEVPNWQARLRASDQLFKVHGGYAPKQVHVEGNIRVGADLDEREELTRLCEEFGLTPAAIEAEFAAVDSNEEPAQKPK